MTGSRGRAHPEINAESVARALGGVTRSRNGWRHARCPAHDDRGPSLRLHDIADGGTAWWCHAGCDSKAVGEALRVRGLLPERTKRRAAAGSKRCQLVPAAPDAA
jgi:hypothetical protein